MYLHPHKNGPSTYKSKDEGADACADADNCSYILYRPSFCNSADADTDTDADMSILAITLIIKIFFKHPLRKLILFCNMTCFCSCSLCIIK